MIPLPTRADLASWAAARSGPALGATVGAVVLAVAVIVAEAFDTGFPPTAAATIVAGLLCLAALLVPPGRLLYVGGAAVTASAALSLTTAQLRHRPEHTFGIVELCLLLLLVTRAVRYGPPTRMLPLAAAAWLAAPLLLLRLPGSELTRVAGYLGPVLLLAAPVVAVLGLYLRLLDSTREQQKNARLNDQRLEFARELHDFVGHHVTAITAQVKAVRFITAAGQPPTPEVLDQALANIEDAAAQATGSMRAMVDLLRRPDRRPPLHAPGGLQGLHALADSLRSLGAAGPAVGLTIDPRLEAEPPADHVAATVHHLVREALTNVRKHADRAGSVTVDVRLSADDPGVLTVCVQDDAAPRPAAQTLATPTPAAPSEDRRGGFGLLGVHERVHALGGQLTAGPGPVGGWQVAADIPLGRGSVPDRPPVSPSARLAG
ncbi:sensor histidine kinase [Kitasatospora sp. NPDC089509]|uniref:sensor histidine kinase n=1 Tax=Kitasatospora sp. NPDC089509 TaxID=3364079 RepID=UPI00381D676D